MGGCDGCTEDPDARERQDQTGPLSTPAAAKSVPAPLRTVYARRVGAGEQALMLSWAAFGAPFGTTRAVTHVLRRREGTDGRMSRVPLREPHPYHYIPGKESLLDGAVETVIDALYGDPDVHMMAYASWPDYLQRLAHGVRRIALAHPQVFPLIATRPSGGPVGAVTAGQPAWMENFWRH